MRRTSEGTYMLAEGLKHFASQSTVLRRADNVLGVVTCILRHTALSRQPWKFPNFRKWTLQICGNPGRWTWDDSSSERYASQKSASLP